MTRASTASAVPHGHQGAIDYLIIGHVTIDLMPDGHRLGGTAAYASLTALKLGLRVGLVTACRPDLELTPLRGIAIHRKPSTQTTTFRNLATPHGRSQVLSGRADSLTIDDVPPAWRTAPIAHLAPVADEVSAELASDLSATFVGATPQGWWRKWDADGHVMCLAPADALGRLPSNTQAAVFSRDDVSAGSGDLDLLRHAFPITVTTDGARGADVSWESEQLHVPAPVLTPVDDTGAGDIFAAVFFVQLAGGKKPAEAAFEATRWASLSVLRAGTDWIRSAEIDEIAAGANL